jgi:protein O-GlcNAc transferase
LTFCLNFFPLLAGLGRLVAKTEDEYVNLALDLASDVNALQELRMSLRELMMKSPVCDGEKFTCGLEAAYRNMWHRYCDGDVPSLRHLELLQEHPIVNKQDSDKTAEKLADLKAQKANATVEEDKEPPIMANGATSPGSPASAKCEANGHCSQ